MRFLTVLLLSCLAITTASAQNLDSRVPQPMTLPVRIQAQEGGTTQSCKASVWSGATPLNALDRLADKGKIEFNRDNGDAVFNPVHGYFLVRINKIANSDGEAIYWQLLVAPIEEVVVDRRHKHLKLVKVSGQRMTDRDFFLDRADDGLDRTKLTKMPPFVSKTTAEIINRSKNLRRQLTRLPHRRRAPTLYFIRTSPDRYLPQ